MQTIDDVVRRLRPAQVSTIYKSLNQYHVVMELEPKYWQNPDSLREVYVRGANNVQIPLSEFYRQATSNTPLAVNHSGQFPSTTISFNLSPGTSLGDVVPLIEKAAADLVMPDTIQGKFQGTARAFRTRSPINPFSSSRHS